MIATGALSAVTIAFLCWLLLLPKIYFKKDKSGGLRPLNEKRGRKMEKSSMTAVVGCIVIGVLLWVMW